MEQLTQPQFRVFFAIQQAIIWQKSLNPTIQIFSRSSVSQELRIIGSFSSFVMILRNLIQLAIRSYTSNSLEKLVFVTTDLDNSNLVVRITAGGSAFQSVVSDSLSEPSKNQNQLLAESIHLIENQFLGSFEFRSFPTHGTQAVIKLPVQSDNQIHDRS